MTNKFLVILTLVSVFGSEIKAEKYTDVHDVYNRCTYSFFKGYADICSPEFAKFKDDINKLDESGRTVLDRSQGDARREAFQIIAKLGGKSGNSVRAELLARAKKLEEQKTAAEVARLKTQAEAKRSAQEDFERVRRALAYEKTETAPQAVALPAMDEAEKLKDEKARMREIAAACEGVQGAKDADLLKWGRCCC